MHLFKRRDIFAARIEFHRISRILLALNFPEIHMQIYKFSLDFRQNYSPDTFAFPFINYTRSNIYSIFLSFEKIRNSKIRNSITQSY